MTTYEGKNHRFTINDDGRQIDCYLKVGFVGEEHLESFPHLGKGEICFVDLTVSNKTDESKGLEIVFRVATEYIKDGGKIDSAIRVMMYQRYNPLSVMHDDDVDLRGSICDYVGRYLEDLK